MKTINKEIKLRRERLGISQAQLAERVGVAWQAVQQWENGKTSPARKRETQIARALECQVSDLHGIARPYYDRTQPEPTLTAQDSQQPHLLKFGAWPFARIEYSRFTQLIDEDRAYVEGRVMAAIEECEIRRGMQRKTNIL